MENLFVAGFPTMGIYVFVRNIFFVSKKKPKNERGIILMIMGTSDRQTRRLPSTTEQEFEVDGLIGKKHPTGTSTGNEHQTANTSPSLSTLLSAAPIIVRSFVRSFVHSFIRRTLSHRIRSIEFSFTLWTLRCEKLGNNF